MISLRKSSALKSTGVLSLDPLLILWQCVPGTNIPRCNLECQRPWQNTDTKHTLSIDCSVVLSARSYQEFSWSRVYVYPGRTAKGFIDRAWFSEVSSNTFVQSMFAWFCNALSHTPVSVGPLCFKQGSAQRPKISNVYKMLNTFCLEP